jgi:hypothetical protein
VESEKKKEEKERKRDKKKTEVLSFFCFFGPGLRNNRFTKKNPIRII